MKPSTNRRQYKRLRIDRTVQVPVHVFPVLPFLGESIDANIVNISSGGMALVIDVSRLQEKVSRGSRLRIHFRLPGQPLCDCAGLVTHSFRKDDRHACIGIRFTKTPDYFTEAIKKMELDNDHCDKRITETPFPWCEYSCSYYSLCTKPLRHTETPVPNNCVEIAFQQLD